MSDGGFAFVFLAMLTIAVLIFFWGYESGSDYRYNHDEQCREMIIKHMAVEGSPVPDVLLDHCRLDHSDLQDVESE